MDTQKFNVLLKNYNRFSSASYELYAFFYPRILLHVSRNYRSVCAEDVAQEFFLKLARTDLSAAPYVLYPTSWVYHACDNLAKTAFSRAFRYREVASDQMDEKNIDAASDNLYDHMMQRDEIKGIFGQLDETTREIFYLFYWEGYDFSEISSLTGVKLSAVKQRHTRSLKKIKNILKKM